MEVWNITELMHKVSVTSFATGSRTWVNVTHIETPENFYVRPTAYNSYLPIIENFHGAKKVPASILYLGSVFLFKSKTLKHWVRGEIHQIPEAENVGYTLFAIDYGFVEDDVPLKFICKPETDLSAPPLSMTCQLADCKPMGPRWTRDSIDAMKFYVGTERAIMVVRGEENNKLIVDLRNSSPDDIATLMALTGYSTLGYDCNSVSRLITPAHENRFLTYKKYAPNDYLHVRVMSGNSLEQFYVAEVKDYKEYIREKQDFKNHMKRSKTINVESFKVGTPVGVFLMGRGTSVYERGIIKVIITPESEAMVQLVDWGTMHRLNISDMLEMSEYYCSKPAKAIYCTSDESQLWENGLPKFLYPGYEFNITVIKAGHKFDMPYTVKMSQIKGH